MDFGASLTAGSLIASLMVSSVGFSFFLYGKKQVRLPQLIVGVTLMVLPALVSDPLPMASVSAACLGATWLAVRSGA